MTDTEAKIQAIKERVAECIKRAEQLYNVTMPYVQIRFDLRGKCAGVAGYINRFSGRQYYVKFNRSHLLLGGKTWEHLINDTVPHELAHTVCQAFPKLGRGHDAGWKRVCIALGGNGKTRYSQEDAPEAVALNRPYVYITTVGKEVRVTKVIHSKIQRGTTYTYRGGLGQLNSQCQYSYAASVGEPKVLVTKTTAPVAPAAPARKPAQGASKAQLVRAMIANGWTQEVCVARAVSDLGMTTALAKTYVKNNWNKG